MWLDELDQLVQTLADRIKQHGHVLRGNEYATRYALIDPLLAGLGWNLADPSEVVAEYRLGDSGDRKADYAMLYDGEPYLIVEAKNLGERLSKAAEQAGRYALTTRAQYVVLTNGEQWEGYSLGGPDKHVFQFNVSRSGSGALDLLWLWHGNFRGKTTQPKLHGGPVDEVPVSASSSPPASPKPPTRGVPLPDVKYTKGMSAPRRLTFPDGTTKDVSKSWASVHAETAKWLIDNGRVMSLPLCNKNGTHLMHKRPVRKDGTPFKPEAAREIRENFWIDMNFGPSNHLRKTAELLLSCDVDLNSVRLELD